MGSANVVRDNQDHLHPITDGGVYAGGFFREHACARWR
jgi:hypothetical protein